METVIVQKHDWEMLIESAEHLGGCAIIGCGYCDVCRIVVEQCKAGAAKQQLVVWL